MSSLILWGIVDQLELTFFLPPLSAIFSTLVEIGTTKVFLTALKDTGYAFFAGTFSVIAIGIPVGILMGKNRLIDELLLPWVNMFISAPLDALVPVLIVLFTIAFTIAEFPAHLERKVEYCAARRLIQ